MFNLFKRRRGMQASRGTPADGVPHDNATQRTAPQGAIDSKPAAALEAGEPPVTAQAGPPASAPASAAAGDARMATGSGEDVPPGAPPSGGAPPPNAGNPPPRGLALDDITRGMQHAAAAANQLLSLQYTTVLDQFFDQNEDGLLTPRAVEVALDAEHTMPVPLVALATPRGLALDRMVVHLTVRADFTETLPAGGLVGGDQRGRFFVTLAPPSARPNAEGQQAQRDSQHIDIEMQFAALDPPEAIMRVIDEYTHRLVPRARHDDEEKRHA
ncbi:hypothetical protein DSC91_002002 [Paraburkholderia caffeinilytica]|uniref:DUF2589 domain-containing protein n=1 Tax=Paraburkholderia caffeinilytica TaxID=1761016 RepID=A0ABQ1MEQ1_9BURK|nr:DUF2589 domain-containing protein [Paraburkholderia caffeinilytica]AXL49989.1 hypothetical protein DSC91_002002 [Paraburkholderia caffeinilytica]GGC39464.1 hypothetical protein GCM10011400_27730 [Paraburkholderia caffeinilytica]CAB3786665.1 hypothetical protein LMG28690_02277 [Paraburkholderia caffeinilytica]